jgi:predicted PurR-regulated permease PerM
MKITTVDKYPFFVKIGFIFICLFALVFTLWIGKNILIPIVYALILAILVNPIVNFLMKYKVPKVVAIGISMLLAFSFFSAILYFLVVQSLNFSDLIPEIKIKFAELSTQFLNWFSFNTSIKVYKIEEWLLETRNDELNNIASGKNITVAGNFAMTAVLLPVYLCLILYYKPLFIEFIRRLLDVRHHLVMEEVLNSTKNIIQRYLVGLFFELIIIAVLNATGLFILGIEYPILLGILGAILNLIPYLGGIIAALIFMTVALVTKTPIYMLYVLIMYSFTQFIDNNFIIPRIVAARVQINAFISIIVVFIGGAIWGIPGMFLSIPVTGIIKVIFDHIDSLKPWGFLLGDIVPTKKTNIVQPAMNLVSKFIKPKS